MSPPRFPRPSRRARWAILGLAATAGLLSYAIVRGANRGNDFKYPYGAARLLWTTGALRVDSQPRYPVTFHALLAPLASRPIGQAAAVWAVASVAAIGALPWLFRRLAGVAYRRQVVAWVAVAPFFVDAVVMGQSDPINVFLVTAGLVASKSGRGALGAGLVGLAGMIKILPAVQWATILARTRSRGVWLGVALSAAAGFGVVALAVGPGPALDGFRRQYEWIRDHEKPWHLVARGGDLRPNNESLPIVLARTFGNIPDEFRFPEAVVVARWPLGVIWAAWGLVLSALVAAWLVASVRASRLEPGRAWLGTFALTSVVMLASTPICWHHYFLWTLPAALFLADRPRLVAGVAAAQVLGSASATARACGVHTAIALGLFSLVARRMIAGPGPEGDGDTGAGV